MQSTDLWQLVLTLSCVVVLAYFFAQAEIHIEGDAGWAANLPTWRIEKHWLLDLFWGGRAMTGYHAWVFLFIAIFFHFPLCFMAQWSWQLEARVVGSIMLFWIIEDFLWFISYCHVIPFTISVSLPLREGLKESDDFKFHLPH